LVFAALLAVQSSPGDPSLAVRIPPLLHTVLAANDATLERAAEAEARQIFLTRGLPTIADVGEEAAYEFVFLTCTIGPEDLSLKLLSKAKQAASRKELASDAVVYCEARIRQEMAKARAGRGRSSHPALRDEIRRLFAVDQAARQKQGFDRAAMAQADREHEAPLRAIFDKYGVPTYATVGAEAASSFVAMVQHQSAEFRKTVLPKLKAQCRPRTGRCR
jgi:hypothetical protein